MKKLKILTKDPFRIPRQREINPSGVAEQFHKIVGGYFELLPVQELAEKGIDLFGNEDARRLNLEPNLYCDDWGYDAMCLGTVIAASHDKEGETISLTDEQMEIARNWLNEHSILNRPTTQVFEL